MSFPKTITNTNTNENTNANANANKNKTHHGCLLQGWEPGAVAVPIAQPIRTWSMEHFSEIIIIHNSSA